MSGNLRTNILETERLVMSELETGDAPFLMELLNTPGWLRFIGDRNVRTYDQAIAYLENGPFKSYRQNGFGLYRVELKTNGEAIGLCGILKRDNLEIPDVGYAFLPAYHGQGYAVEAVRALVSYAKGKLKIATLAAITLPDNAKSIRVLENTGFLYIKTISFPGSNEVLHLYRN